MFLDPNGNLGIGTVSPFGKLHVSAADAPVVALINGATKGVRIGTTATYAAVQGVDNTGTASYQPLYIDGSVVAMQTGATGNVGVNTTAPGSKLSVNGNISLPNAGVISFQGVTVAATTSNYSMYGDNTQTAMNAPASGYLQFQINAVTKMIVTTTGNVGIGTVSPHNTLAVNGSIEIAAGGAGLAFNAWYNSGWIYEANGAAAFIVPDTSRLRFYVAPDGGAGGAVPFNQPVTMNANGGMTIGSGYAGSTPPSDGLMVAGSVTFGGSLGVGTTTPQTKLAVTGPSQAYSGSGADGIFQITTGTGAGTDNKLMMGVVDASYSWIQAAKPGTTAYPLVLNPSAGNVGIGTTAPGAALTVSRNAALPSITGWTPQLHVVGPDTGQAHVIVDSQNGQTWLGLRRARGTAAAQTAVQSGDIIASILAQGYATTLMQACGRIDFIATENYADAAHGGAIAFNTVTNTTAPAVERMRIDHSGNVGIGTTGPASKLHVDNGYTTIGRYSASGALVLQTAAGTQGSPTAQAANTNTGTIFFRGYDGTAYRDVAQIAVWTDNAVITSTSSPGFIVFNTTPTGAVSVSERMRIDSAGNVGIGTTGPGGKLHIAKAGFTDLRLQDTTGAGNYLWAAYVAGAGYVSVTGADYLYLQTANAARVTLDPTGNVGIGTTGPNVRLTVVGPNTNAFAGSFQNPHATAGDQGVLVAAGAAGADSTTNVMTFYNGPVTAAQGSITRTGAAGVVYFSVSDARHKQQITDSKIGLEELMKLRVRDYNPTEDGIEHGLVAQEVAEVYPAVVRRGGDDSDTQPWMISYERFTPLLIGAVQQLTKRVAVLEGRVQ
jgi:hypothetical protein